MTYNYKISKNNKIPLFWLGTFVSVHFFQDWVKIFCQKNKRQRQRHRQSDSKTQHMLYFWNPDDLLIPNMMIDTSPWSSCSRHSPWLPCSSHTISSTGPSLSPFRDFFYSMSLCIISSVRAFKIFSPIIISHNSISPTFCTCTPLQSLLIVLIQRRSHVLKIPSLETILSKMKTHESRL